MLDSQLFQMIDYSTGCHQNDMNTLSTKIAALPTFVVSRKYIIAMNMKVTTLNCRSQTILLLQELG